MAHCPVAPQDTEAVIIDGTERRRQRPENAEKQARHYSGKKKTHTDKNVVLTSADEERVLFLSGTYPGATNDKRIADEAHLRYPPGTTLYKDAGFQGYEPVVQKTCQSKKKAEGARVNGHGEEGEPQVGEAARARGACHRRGKAQSDCQGRVSEQEARGMRSRPGQNPFGVLNYLMADEVAPAYFRTSLEDRPGSSPGCAAGRLLAASPRNYPTETTTGPPRASP
jgi:hypothetical protein